MGLARSPCTVGKDVREREKNGKEDDFQYVCDSDQVASGQSGAFSIIDEHGRSKIEVALFNPDGIFYAISNVCVHQGGPLSKGTLEKEGEGGERDIVTCPWHG
jgi:nitrite reductase (NADH) small subunit